MDSLNVLKTVDPDQQACEKLADQNLISHSVKNWNPLSELNNNWGGV